MTNFTTSTSKFKYDLGKHIFVSSHEHVLCVLSTSILFPPPAVPLDLIAILFIPSTPSNFAILNICLIAPSTILNVLSIATLAIAIQFVVSPASVDLPSAMASPASDIRSIAPSTIAIPSIVPFVSADIPSAWASLASSNTRLVALSLAISVPVAPSEPTPTSRNKLDSLIDSSVKQFLSSDDWSQFFHKASIQEGIG